MGPYLLKASALGHIQPHVYTAHQRQVRSLALSAGLAQLGWENRRTSCGDRRLMSVGLAQLVWVLTQAVSISPQDRT